MNSNRTDSNTSTNDVTTGAASNTVRKIFNPGHGIAGTAGPNGTGADDGTGRKLRVAAYCRVSTDMEDQATSFDAQVRFYTNLIQSNPDWEFAGVYADDGITGTSAEVRPEFMRMIEDCGIADRTSPNNSHNNSRSVMSPMPLNNSTGLTSSGSDGTHGVQGGRGEKRIDLILTKSISRFARNTLECLDYVRKLKNNGVGIIFESNNIDTRSAYCEMLITILAAFAQEESRSISENTKWGIRRRFEQGEARWCKIYGYEEGYKINTKEAAVVQKIFSLYEHGMSVLEIRKWLKEHEIRNASGGLSWSQSQVCSLLANEKYTGDLLMQKFYAEDHITHKDVKNDFTEIPSYFMANHHTPIVTHKQFQRVQAIRAVRLRQSTKDNVSTSYNEQYPFGEKLRCPYCGSILYQRDVAVQKEKGKGWCCEKGGNPCEQFIIRSRLVEEAVMKAYRELNLRLVASKLENPKLKKAAEITISMKKKYPSFNKVDYWWIDELIDHIEFGQHSKTQRELMREKAALMRAHHAHHAHPSTSTTTSDNNGTASNNGNGTSGNNSSGSGVAGTNGADTGTGAVADDRTMRIFWRCGIISTVSSGVIKDKDDPKFVAKLFKKAQENKKEREERQSREMQAAKQRSANYNALVLAGISGITNIAGISNLPSVTSINSNSYTNSSSWHHSNSGGRNNRRQQINVQREQEQQTEEQAMAV